MIEAEKEQIRNAEVLVQKNAKTLMSQLQSVTFINKKANAIGKTLVTTDKLLSELTHHNDETTEQLAKITENQKTNDERTQKIIDIWKTVEEQQKYNQTTLETIKNKTENTKHEQETHVKDIMQNINENKIIYTKDNIKMTELISNILNKLDTVDNRNKIQEVKKEVSELTDIINQRMEKQKQARQERQQEIEALKTVSVMLAKYAQQYGNTLTTIESKIDKLEITINSIDKKASKLTPKEFNMSEDDILTMFENLADEDIKEKEESESESESKNEENHLMTVPNAPLAIETAETIETEVDSKPRDVTDTVEESETETVEEEKPKWKLSNLWNRVNNE